MPLYAVNDFSPQVHPSAWVAPSAEIMGQVLVQADASVSAIQCGRFYVVFRTSA